MRIVYVGNFLHSWCTEVHVSRDAERIPGVEVFRLQEPSDPAAAERFLPVIEATASEADLLIYQRTWGLPLEATALWRRLEARGCKTASYHLDLYVGLPRGESIIGDPFWSTGTVFTADGDPATQAFMEAHDIDHRWLPAAIVSDEVYYLTPRASRPASLRGVDVVFVGSHTTYHPEWPWRQQLLDALAARYGARFRRFPTNNMRIHGAQLNNLYTHVPVVVGDSLALPGHTNYWSDRYYETLGRGGYLVGPNVPGIEQHLTDGVHLDLYDLCDVEHVYELIDNALDDREGARQIARAGQEHVAAHHTYTHRVREMLESLGYHGAERIVTP